MANLEFIEWCDIWVTGASVTDRRRRVLMIGDSITRSYYAGVEKILGEGVLCARVASSRCVSDPKLKKELALLLKEFRFAVIHFNNGLHGWDYSEPEYAEGLAETLEFVTRHGHGANVVLASTTPVWQKGQPGVLAPKTERVRERNRIARDLAAQLRLSVNDLFELVIGHPEYFADDGVHLNENGQQTLSRAVADAILREKHERSGLA